MDTQNETIVEVIWTVTELEMAGRDLLDIGIWETAEEEERLCGDTAPDAVSPATCPVSVRLSDAVIEAGGLVA